MKKTAILSASVEFIAQPFLKPLQLSSGLITQATEARVTVRVRCGDQEGTGRGSIYLSDLWAWPGSSPDRDTKDAAMRGLCQLIADALFEFCGGEEEHPLELGLRLHHSVDTMDSVLPILARAVCASPFDAAIHDAVGHALQISAFSFYSAHDPIPSADHLFPGEGACQAIQKTLHAPSANLNAWWIVGAKDDLEGSVRPAIATSGIRHFKLKVLGKDNAADAARTAEVFQAAKRWGLDPVISIDSNEGNPDAAAVLDYLEQLEQLDPEAYAALAYLEQPTDRDIQACPQDWNSVCARKPVLLDEGLTSLSLLPLVKEQKWSGLALKTCKGHSFTLVSAAWAQRNGLLLAVQDLTNPGFAAIHSFLLGSRLTSLNGVELNSPQYTPAANEPWTAQLGGLFKPISGVHHLDNTSPAGLGSTLVKIS